MSAKIKCMDCGGPMFIVKTLHQTDEKNGMYKYTYRVRQCKSCGKRRQTYEYYFTEEENANFIKLARLGMEFLDFKKEFQDYIKQHNIPKVVSRIKKKKQEEEQDE